MKQVTIEGIDNEYTFGIEIVNKDKISDLIGNEISYTNVGATFIDNIAYFYDLSDDCISHECLHIAFECLRKTTNKIDFNELLLDKDIATRNLGEEAIAFTYSEILSEVKNSIKEMTC